MRYAQAETLFAMGFDTIIIIVVVVGGRRVLSRTHTHHISTQLAVNSFFAVVILDFIVTHSYTNKYIYDVRILVRTKKYSHGIGALRRAQVHMHLSRMCSARSNELWTQ